MTLRVDLSHIREPLETYPWPVMLNQGYHWMDKYGDAHWIPEMDTDYLENALRFARGACRQISNRWWRFAFSLNGEVAVDTAESIAMRYDEYDVPLIKGLELELALRRGEDPPEADDLGTSWDPRNGYYDWAEWKGYEHMAVSEALRRKGLYSTPTLGIYKIGEPWDPKKDS